jgi:phage gp29-like protein
LLLQAGMEIPRKWFYDRHAVPMPQEGEDVVKQETETASFLGKETVTAEEQLPSATDKLATNILEEVTGVSEKWLSPIKPTFTELVGKAMKSEVSDSDFVAALSKAEGLMPELFDEIDTSVLEKALEDAMGAAAVNGAVQRISNAPAMPE